MKKRIRWQQIEKNTGNTATTTTIFDLIYQKVLRTKQIEDNNGQTLVSEGLDANYFDMLNYAVFCLIKMEVGGRMMED